MNAKRNFKRKVRGVRKGIQRFLSCSSVNPENPGSDNNRKVAMNAKGKAKPDNFFKT